MSLSFEVPYNTWRCSVSHVIKMAHRSLKKDGYLIFLATPNTNSILFRIKQDLPFLDPKLNFYIPGAKGLSNALSNFGFEVKKIDYLTGTPLTGEQSKIIFCLH